MTEVLRDRVPGGERIVSSVRDTLFAYLYRAKGGGADRVEAAFGAPQGSARGRAVARADGRRAAARTVKPVDLGIDVEGMGADGMIPGNWYAAKGNPGIYASVIVPGWISPEIMGSHRNLVNAPR